MSAVFGLRSSVFAFALATAACMIAALSSSPTTNPRPTTENLRPKTENRRPKTEDRGPNTVTIAAVGDIMLDRGTGRQMTKYGRDFLFKDSKTILRVADVAIGNLECVLSRREFQVNQQFLFHAPPDLADILKDAGLSILNLANNHSMDCGLEGLQDTTEALKRAGIQYCGVTEPDGAQLPTIIEKSGIRIAFLGYCAFKPPIPGIAFAVDEAVKREVALARRSADLVVVSFHWGREMHDEAAPAQIHLARVASDAGSDLILGHHPHVLQKTELLNPHYRITSPPRQVSRSQLPRPSGRGPRPVLFAYSLGGFVWDGHSPREKKSAILSCVFDRAGLVAADWIPMRIEHCSPRRSSEPVKRLFHR